MKKEAKSAGDGLTSTFSASPRKKNNEPGRLETNFLVVNHSEVLQQRSSKLRRSPCLGGTNDKTATQRRQALADPPDLAQHHNPPEPEQIGKGTKMNEKSKHKKNRNVLERFPIALGAGAAGCRAAK